ncbi:MAG: hypothetical protein DRP79_07660 [Planctomycetota bacterium]|nr:MAG: hypothetical protein DRP79_07660 [Planctomycetota bacterium]
MYDEGVAALQGATGKEFSQCGGFMLNYVVALKDYFGFSRFSDQAPDRREGRRPVCDPPRHEEHLRAVTLYAQCGLEPCYRIDRVQDVRNVLRGQGRFTGVPVVLSGKEESGVLAFEGDEVHLVAPLAQRVAQRGRVVGYPPAKRVCGTQQADSHADWRHEWTRTGYRLRLSG